MNQICDYLLAILFVGLSYHRSNIMHIISDRGPRLVKGETAKICFWWGPRQYSLDGP